MARAVKRHGCALAAQLLHLGLRTPTPFLKTGPARHPDESRRASCRRGKFRADTSAPTAPYRTGNGTIAIWLAEQAAGNGATIKTNSPVSADNIDAVLAAVRSHHVVVAIGARYRRDGFQGQTGKPLPGWEKGNCVTWDEVALDKVKVAGGLLVVDELADVAAPLTAVKLAKLGSRVRLLTKWPMIGWETAAEVYLHWISTYLYEAEVEMITDHAVKSINGTEVEIANVYQPSRTRPVSADAIVMATPRSSENALYHLLRKRRGDRLRGCAAHGLRGDAGRPSRRAQARRRAMGAERRTRRAAEPGVGVTLDDAA